VALANALGRDEPFGGISVILSGDIQVRHNNK